MQGLALVLLETLVKNCEGLFSDVAAAGVLDDLVGLGRDGSNPNSTKALILIEAWGEATDELRYLPVFAETLAVSTRRGAPSRTLPHAVPSVFKLVGRKGEQTGSGNARGSVCGMPELR